MKMLTLPEHIFSHFLKFSRTTAVLSKRENLESHLNVSKMYDLYKNKSSCENVEAIKKSLFYHIFPTEFDNGFTFQKKAVMIFEENT